MTVLLANRSMGIRRRTVTMDAHGDRAKSGYGVLAGPWPGRAEEKDDAPIGQVGGRPWVLAVDPAAWPVNQQDVIVDVDSKQEWVVTKADLRTNNIQNFVDYVRVEAHARTAAGTRP